MHQLYHKNVLPPLPPPDKESVPTLSKGVGEQQGNATITVPMIQLTLAKFVGSDLERIRAVTFSCMTILALAS